VGSEQMKEFAFERARWNWTVWRQWQHQQKAPKRRQKNNSAAADKPVGGWLAAQLHRASAGGNAIALAASSPASIKKDRDDRHSNKRALCAHTRTLARPALLPPFTRQFGILGVSWLERRYRWRRR